MSSVDVEKLLQPLSEDAPCGTNLEYDPDYFKFDEAAEGKPEREMGPGNVDPAEPPDWKVVRSVGLDLLGRTRDLRIHVKMARAAIATQGCEAFRDWLNVIRGSLSTFWESVHPRIDDDNDPMERVNALSGLCAFEETLNLFPGVELASAPGLGKLTLHDVLVSRGERKAADDRDPMNQAQMDAIFKASELGPVQSRAQAAADSVTLVQEIDKILTDKVGSGQACSFAAIGKQLEQLSKILADGLATRDDVAAPAEAGAAATAAAGSDPATAAAAVAAHAGELRSRDDVVRALERIIKFYESQEPSSPIPVLLSGAKRLATMDFLEIMNVVTADGLKHLKAIAGVEGKK